MFTEKKIDWEINIRTKKCSAFSLEVSTEANICHLQIQSKIKYSISQLKYVLTFKTQQQQICSEI